MTHFHCFFTRSVPWAQLLNTTKLEKTFGKQSFKCLSKIKCDKKIFPQNIPPPKILKNG